MGVGPQGLKGHKLGDAGRKRRWEEREARKLLEKKRREDLCRALEGDKTASSVGVIVRLVATSAARNGDGTC